MGLNGKVWPRQFHCAGMPVAVTLFCKPCLANGHQCPAREGSEECIFCEDKAPCPAMQRAVTAHTQERPSSASPRLLSDSLLSPEALAKKRAKSVAVHAEKPEKFMDNGGKELIAAAVKSGRDRKENKMSRAKQVKTVPCKFPDCPTKITERCKSGYCAKHFYAGKLKGGTPKTKRPAATPKVQRAAAKSAAIAWHPEERARIEPTAGERTVATLLVSEQQINLMFLGWSLEDKVSCIQGWLDRLES